MRALRCGRDEITSFNVEPAVGSTPPSAGVTPAPGVKKQKIAKCCGQHFAPGFFERAAMILHIVGESEWVKAVGLGSYAPASLATEGFVHCSTLAQVVATANRFYRGESGLVVLCIEEERLRVELRYERAAEARGEGAGEWFPHLYGALNVDAVVRVVKLPCEADGSFRLPEGLRDSGSSLRCRDFKYEK